MGGLRVDSNVSVPLMEAYARKTGVARAVADPPERRFKVVLPDGEALLVGVCKNFNTERNSILFSMNCQSRCTANR